MNIVDINDLRTSVKAGQIIWTEHLILRLRERNIKRADIVSCIQTGEIIEQYPDDMPFPSCLILGNNTNNSPLHVVCAMNQDLCCCMISAYYPNPDKWEPNNKTRKAGKTV